MTTYGADEVLFDRTSNQLMITISGVKREIPEPVRRLSYTGYATVEADEKLTIMQFNETKDIEVEDGVARVTNK